jgi:hypothetical protein
MAGAALRKHLFSGRRILGVGREGDGNQRHTSSKQSLHHSS